MGIAQGVGTEASGDERDERSGQRGDRIPSQATDEPVPKKAEVGSTIVGMLRNILDGSTWDEHAVICNVLGKAYIKDPCVRVEVIAIEQGDLVHELVPRVQRATLKTKVDWWGKVVPQITVQVRAVRQKFDAQQAEHRRRRHRRQEEAQYEWGGGWEEPTDVDMESEAETSPRTTRQDAGHARQERQEAATAHTG